MKRYEKPSIHVMDLQLKENIAAIDTTVYTGVASSYSNAELVNLALGVDINGDLLQTS